MITISIFWALVIGLFATNRQRADDEKSIQ
jgi:hypothetical protein